MINYLISYIIVVVLFEIATVVWAFCIGKGFYSDHDYCGHLLDGVNKRWFIGWIFWPITLIGILLFYIWLGLDKMWYKSSIRKILYRNMK